MRQKTMRLVFWGVLAVLSSSLLVMAGMWVGEKTGAGGRNNIEQAENDGDSEYKNAMFGAFAEALKDADDIEDDDRDQAMKHLREGDLVFSESKRQNREAMRRANRHPRIVPPKRKAKAPAPVKTPKQPKSDSPGNSDQPK